VKGSRHRVIALLVLLFGITYLDRVCISVAGPLMQRDLRIGPVGWGWVTGMFTVFALAEDRRVAGIRPKRAVKLQLLRGPRVFIGSTRESGNERQDDSPEGQSAGRVADSGSLCVILACVRRVRAYIGIGNLGRLRN
jgi:hypothetical protein